MDNQQVALQTQANDAETTELVRWLRNRTVVLRTALEQASQEVQDLTQERDDLRRQLDDDTTQDQEASA